MTTTKSPDVTDLSVTYVSTDLERTTKVPVAEFDPTEVFEFPAVRKIANHGGRTNRIGKHFCTTTRTLVIYESMIERAVIQSLDQDPTVMSITSQALMVHGSRRGKQAWQVPDLIVQTTDETISFVHIKPRGTPQLNEWLPQAAADELGWGYRLLHEPNEHHHKNLELISHYRHQLHEDDPLPAGVLERLADGPSRLDDLADDVAGWSAALPVIGHLLWWNQIEMDWDTPIWEGTIVRLPHAV